MDITVIVALITAIAAIVAPVITSVINSRSALKLKELDMLQNNVYAAVSELTDSFSKLYDCNASLPACWNFMSAAYKTMYLIHDTTMQEQLSAIIAAIRSSHGNITPDTVTAFNRIVSTISNYLRADKRI